MIKDTIENNENVLPNDKEMQVLKENFPACFKNDGSFDLERFKEYLNDKVTVTNEGYELKFLGKNYARLLASMDTTTVITPDEEHNNKPENKDSENIYISGDNLDGLKHLLKSYAGQIKCIYIDPPYNTGYDGFVYNDSFNFTSEELSTKLSIDEEQSKRILDLTKRGSASHSAWLMFMYPRLLLARDLLKDDGVIFISIDDNEQSNLKLLCDDVFGEENFIGCISRATGTTTGQDANKIGSSLDYCLVYSKTDKFSLNGLPLDESDEARFDLEDEKGKYSILQLRKTGDADTREDRPNMFYSIKAPDNSDVYPFGPTSYLSRWRVAKNSFEKLNNDGMIVWKENTKLNLETIDGITRSKWVPYVKYYLNGRTKQVSNLLEGIEGNKKASLCLKELFGIKKIFTNPKPVEFVQTILNICCDENEIILDFFSGSATTAHAVMQKNILDNLHNKYIIVQLPENIKKNSEAEKAGYKTIDQIGMDRIVLAGKKLLKDNPTTTADLGFKHYTLKDVTNETLDKLEEFKPNKQGMLLKNDLLHEFGSSTILTTWLVHDGYGFNGKVKELDFAGYKGYWCDKHLYLINSELSKDAIAKIVEKFETDGNFNPENIVLFGYSFLWTEMDELKINLNRLKETEKNLRINYDVRY